MALALDGPISLIFVSVCRDLLLRVRTASPILVCFAVVCFAGAGRLLCVGPGKFFA